MCSINHDLKAIFIHIPKTAGSYMADVLQKYYGFKNYYLHRPDHERFCLHTDGSVRKHENKIHGTYIYYKTSPYCNKVMGMTPEKWDSYYKFCFIRNPYDKIISGWNYVNVHNIPFQNYIEKPLKRNSWDYWHVFMPQTRHILNEKAKITDMNFIGKYENLEDDFLKVLNHLGIQRKHPFYSKNSKKHESFYKYYNQYSLSKVNELLKEDFVHLSYPIYTNLTDFFNNFVPNSNKSITENIDIDTNNKISETIL